MATARAEDLSVSVLIETANLTTAELGNLERCLKSLAAQTHAMDRVDEVVVLEAADVSARELHDICAPYPWVQVRGVAAGMGYGDVKALGGTDAVGDIVVLADADCTYEPEWLEQLLQPFRDRPDVNLVGGETTTPIGGPYGLAIGMTFVFPRFSGEQELAPALWYWANNMAVRRSFFASLPLPAGLPLYRGQNVVHAELLRQADEVIWRQPRARAMHQLPAPEELVERYVLFGDDTVTMARLVGDRAGRFYRRGMEPGPAKIGRARHFAQRAASVFREDPRRLADLPAALPMVVLCVVAYVRGMARASSRPAPEAAVAPSA